MPKDGWPDFICIGAIKAGTTWLHACLAEHPQVSTPATKEIEYFNNRYDLGPEWYKSFFRDVSGTVAGESTPGYFHDARCAERIYATNRDMKLILCFRNPIDRAFSHFLMDQRSSDEPLAKKKNLFDKMVRQEETKYTQFGLYAKQLQPYLELFPASQFHYIWFDEIENSPEQLIGSAYDYLGIDSDFLPGILRKKVNESSRYRNLSIFRKLQNVTRFLEKTSFQPLILSLKTNGVRDRVLQLFREPEDRPAMLPSTREYLEGFYWKANRELEGLIGKGLDKWQAGD